MSVWRRRVYQPLTAGLAVCLFLFAQLALAGYLCAQINPTQSQAPMGMDGNTPCQAMDSAQPALCHAHCADDGTTIVSFSTPALAPPALHNLLTLTLALIVEHADRKPAPTEPAAQPPPEPLFLFTLRLRV